MIEGHGDDLYRYGDKVKYNFSTNIVSDVDHTGLYSHLNGVMHEIGSYPEPAPYSLETLIAEKLGVCSANVVVTNGATDAMYRIAQIHKEGKSSIYAPAFREYQDACKLHGHKIGFFNKSTDVGEDSDCIWICNPNNPTGEIIGKRRLLNLSERFRKSWLIVDQAYADYVQLPVLTAKDAVKSRNIVLLSSLTKRFAIPGLRVGYAVAPMEMASKIREVGMPWAVNTLAIEAGKYLITHEDDYVIENQKLHSEALRIAEEFNKSGIEVFPTDCNFILCRLPEPNVGELKKHLVQKYGILIRDASNFETLDGRYFRIAAQSWMMNDMLINAVKEWIAR